ncbi:MAG: hypothetical protein IJ589_10235 [Lachnospiraceae bacterium]|nr:hypothetical protein [Lachnospiraceae bacterium]
MANRADLINQLAASMGAGDYASTRLEESRYDVETGTLYCNGYIISRSILDEAVSHFQGLQAKCDIKDPAGRKMAMVYEAAIEGIKRMRKEEKEAERQKNKMVK